ncbi:MULTISPECIES: YdbH domain-containing protein [Pseudomonas]|uniref:intermembrane phospholipid transport protein YdbH family protein n=1 Tax=Pseudomonas TaxID=286 RepID=UPI0013A710E5|nr:MULTISPECIES: YdbH domain-containing protein [Pseudomonas]QIB50173.1 hypothetical protein G3M63_03280 [Pseudomonas sp. OIL-1]
MKRQQTLMRTAFRILIVVLALITLAGIFAVQSAQRALRDAGVEHLDWRGVSWSGNELSVAEITGRYAAEQGDLGFAAWGVQVKLVWEAGPRLELVDVRDLDLDWRPTPGMTFEDPMLDPNPGSPAPASIDQSPASLDPRDWLHVPHWFPAEAAIRDLSLSMPCQQETCELSGSFDARRNVISANSFAAQLALLSGTESLALSVDLRDEADDLVLSSDLALSGQHALALRADWRGATDSAQWQGSVSMPGWPDANWLFGFVDPWLKPGTLPLEQLPTGLQFDANWVLQPGRTPVQWTDLLAGAVRVKGQLNLPQPWDVKDVGAVSGAADFDFQGDKGAWLLHQGTASVQLERLSWPALANLPADVRPVSLQAVIEPEPGSTEGWRAALPLTFSATLGGPVTGTLDTRLSLTNNPALQAELHQGRLQLVGGRIDYAGARFQDLRADLSFEGLVNQQLLSLTLGKSSRLDSAALRLGEADVSLIDTRLELAGLKLDIPFDGQDATRLDAPIRLGASRLEHAMLRPQSWSLVGRLGYGEKGLDWKGVAAAASGLQFGLDMTWPTNAGWRARLTPDAIFLRADNPLALTLTDWPALLDLSAGKLTANFDASGHSSIERLSGRIDLSGGSGIYDRTEFSGLDLPLTMELKGEQVTLATSAITLQSINPGLPVGPARFDGRYQATLGQTLAGELHIEHASTDLLGGRLLLQPTTLDFSHARQKLMVQMQGVELTELFKAYPAEGLSGHGIIDGQLPVTLTDNGVIIENGSLRAREPGGALQYRSDRLAGLGDNPGMRELVLALDDFRYSVLASDIDYAENGTLVLGLRLEGHNPELQQGRPVHLNVRLEEDIPALLASLQLSGQVSDIIQKRVQERLLQRR